MVSRDCSLSVSAPGAGQQVVQHVPYLDVFVGGLPGVRGLDVQADMEGEAAVQAEDLVQLIKLLLYALRLGYGRVLVPLEGLHLTGIAEILFTAYI